jgi:predicted acyltransferase
MLRERAKDRPTRIARNTNSRMSSPLAPQPRLASLDQFRGYTIVGMCLANFLAPFAAIHSVLKHNDTYFSYADTIMPGFLFVVGFAFRLTWLKRRRNTACLATAATYVRRSGKLLLMSLFIYLCVGDVPRWFDYRSFPQEYGMRGEGRGIRESRVPGGEGETEKQKSGDTRSMSSVLPSPLTPHPSPLGDSSLAALQRLQRWKTLGWQKQLLIHWRILAAKLIKSELWETLAIIGATQLVVLPCIGCRFVTRFVVMILLGITHLLLSYWFNWDFLYGVPVNWMSRAWMTGTDRGWDGGVFGPVCWGVVMLGGTLAYDLVAASASRPRAAARLAVWGCGFLAVGYSLSCLTRLYELSGTELPEMRHRHVRQDAQRASLDEAIARQRTALKSLEDSAPHDAARDEKIEQIEAQILALEDERGQLPDLALAESPVLPPWERFRGRTLADLLSEPPFVAPPADDPRADPPPHIEHRLRNYWMLGKRMPNLSFIIFATGFEFAAFALFVVACDVAGWQLGLFRTFGTNPLAAYFIHGAMALVLALTVPHDASLALCLASFAVAFAATYLLVRLLENRGLYWRL